MVIAILVYTSITKIDYINLNQLLSLDLKIQAFFPIGILCFINQLVLLKYLKRKTSQHKSIKQKIWLIYTVTYYSQIIFFAIFIILFIEISLIERNHSFFLASSVGGVSALSTMIMVILGKTFLKCFMIEKNVVLFLYALSFISLSFNIIFSGCMAIAYLSNKPETIYFHLTMIHASFNPNVVLLFYGFQPFLCETNIP